MKHTKAEMEQDMGGEKKITKKPISKTNKGKFIKPAVGKKRAAKK